MPFPAHIILHHQPCYCDTLVQVHFIFSLLLVTSTALWLFLLTPLKVNLWTYFFLLRPQRSRSNNSRPSFPIKLTFLPETGLFSADLQCPPPPPPPPSVASDTLLQCAYAKGIKTLVLYMLFCRFLVFSDFYLIGIYEFCASVLQRK